MIINKNNQKINPELVKEALVKATKIFGNKWLEKQYKKEKKDPLLTTHSDTTTYKNAIHSIKFGNSSQIHPLAESILVGKSVIDIFDKTSSFLPSIELYRLVSLLDVASALKRKIKGIDNKIKKLKSNEWKSTLFEILIAESYSKFIKTELIQESEIHTPDIRLLYSPPMYIECKAKLSYENKLDTFLRKWKKECLGSITSFLSQKNLGCLVQIKISSDSDLSSIPRIIEEMVNNGTKNYKTDLVDIEIAPYEYRELKPPKIMSFHSEEFWKWALNFSDWNNWHHIEQFGTIQFHTPTNLIIKKVKRPQLICVRAEFLADNTINVYQTIKDACRKQLKNHNPGIIHILINTDIFGLGENQDPNVIAESLKKKINDIFHDYSRVDKLVFDIVSPPRRGHFEVNNQRQSFSRFKTALKVPENDPIILW